jgi:ubiquinone/menaquinone biosynthesis C-methylase UbiE
MKEDIKYNFDLIADDYNNYHNSHNNFIEIIKKHSLADKNSILIDVGCGTGNETINLFNNFGCNVIGIEPSEKMIAVGKSKSNNIKWLIGTAEKIPFEDNSVDVITSFFSVHHFDNIQDSIIEFKRVLKDNGKLFIFTISHEQMKNSLEYVFFPDLLSADLSRVPKIEILIDYLDKFSFSSKKVEIHYEDRLIDDYYLEMVNNQYRSGLRLLNSKQLENGIAKIEKIIKDNVTLNDKIMCTVVVASKNKSS